MVQKPPVFQRPTNQDSDKPTESRSRLVRIPGTEPSGEWLITIYLTEYQVLLTFYIRNGDLRFLRKIRASASRFVGNNDCCSLPTIVFYTYIAPLAMGWASRFRSRYYWGRPTYREGILLDSVQPNLCRSPENRDYAGRAAKC